MKCCLNTLDKNKKESGEFVEKTVVDDIKLFGGNLDFPKIKTLKKFVLMPEPAQKCENTF